MLLQHAADAVQAGAGAHPLSGTAAEYLWLVPLLPLLGFVLNGLLSLVSAYRVGPADPGADHDAAHGGGHAVATTHGHATDSGGGAHGDDHHPVVRHRFATLTSIIGPGVLALSFFLAVAIFAAMRGVGGGVHAPFIQSYFAWMPVGDLRINAAFQLDQLSMLMMLIITGVGTLIHIFSVGYMQDDPGYPRYFAYLNLFVFFMLMLVLGANYPVLFVGWEGVGLCSYLLIGFWFSEKANADAGKKAFIVNRIGDFGLLIAMFMLFANLGTLDFVGIAAAAPSQLVFGGALVTAICLFMFLGCAGKSAQIPLYVWLPDAMAGPTPVSALIHAATMVTAGVYLVARSNFLFSLAPAAELTVVLVGALTAIFAATIGLKQWDIKKVLAYSTVSQLGYMFVGVGSGAYVAGVFHLMTHAFFKALLFLGSGSVIFAMHRAYHHTGNHDDAQDMRNMGGLKQYMRTTWILMWIATLAIAGVPFFSGFFSKDEILGGVFLRASEHSTLAQAHWLGIPGTAILYLSYALGLAAAFMTAVYMTRMMLYTFHGPNRTGERERGHLAEAPWTMTGPLVILGVLSAVGGWFNLPALIPLGPVGVLEHWLEPVVGEGALRVTNGAPIEATHSVEYALIGAAVVIAIAGIALAFARLKPDRLVPKAQSPEEHGFERVLANKYYVDEAYDKVVVQPVVATSRGLLWRGVDVGLIDGLTRLIVQSKDDDAAPGTTVPMGGLAARAVGWVGSQVQSGQVGTYAWVLVVGVLFVLGAFTFR
ncbi:MAG: NADH-quinone oxidoreductase subunit L [Gemmatimonadaceae bacterium]|nr:NADH-quinone oxidoreductase subunit L [Gemmatimonadaceae bacterium]NUP55642.1 NADH-quinone oxidoreductase subunit L [Gemmatimonadaceae bacterium]NUP72868.1 NADH-quinone oxidoreductase subunit L [Gemmatimonadaceae bacterium]NUS46650.1 NADH-quinone oxidoreductase subunit L [Gemmatimonadaceae bacterium]